MSFREEERQKNACPSRGFGLAAAAIGVGVGAALYYFFSKRPENPHGEGSTEPGWRSESLQGRRIAINVYPIVEMDTDEYTTISESMTTDTSVHDEDSDEDDVSNNSVSSNESCQTDDDEMDYSDEEDTELSISNSHFDIAFHEVRDLSLGTFTSASGYVTDSVTDTSDSVSESDMSEWDVTSESDGVPEYMGITSSGVNQVFDNIRSMYTRRGRRSNLRDRPWTSEECSICFEVITLNQEVMALPCTHRFHQACILPWLQEKETCPNCRRRAE